MRKLRILLIDDHVLFRKGIASLIATRDDMEIVGEGGDGSQALPLAKETKPDIILMDINMPRMSGIDAVKQVQELLPEISIIMLTVSDDDDDLFMAIKNGAKGYLLKNLQPEELFSLIEGTTRGEAAISGKIAVKILQEFRQSIQPSPSEETLADELTEREVQVLEEVVKGLTNKEIAEVLIITENTVKIHLRNILEKLQVQNRIQAAVYAVREGLVDEE